MAGKDAGKRGKSGRLRRLRLFWNAVELTAVTSWTVLTWGSCILFAASLTGIGGAALFTVCTVVGGIPVMIAGELLSDWYLKWEYRLIWRLRRRRIQYTMDGLTLERRYELPAYDDTERVMQHGFNKRSRLGRLDRLDRDGRRTYP